MNLKDLLIRNRSYRRFYQRERISRDELEEVVGLVRWCPSGRNAQPLRYVVAEEEELCGRIFPVLGWAGYLKDWAGPEEGERPAAYLVQLLDTRVVENCLCDDGIQAQTILLGAVEKGYGGCIIKSFQEEKLRQVLEIPSYLKIMYVLALGKPKEEVVVELMQGEDYKYWRDADGVHHVPKREVKDLFFGH